MIYLSLQSFYIQNKLFHQVKSDFQSVHVSTTRCWDPKCYMESLNYSYTQKETVYWDLIVFTNKFLTNAKQNFVCTLYMPLPSYFSRGLLLVTHFKVYNKNKYCKMVMKIWQCSNISSIASGQFASLNICSGHFLCELLFVTHAICILHKP